MVRRLPVAQRRPKGSTKAEIEIAMLFKRDTGIEIEPKIIHDFILGRFTTLSVLAHEIWDPHVPPGTPR